MTMFRGISGKTSIMRVLVSLVVAVTLGTWVIANIICWARGCQYVSIGIQEVSLILGALAAKAGQRLAENGECAREAPTTDDIPKDKKE